MLMTKAQWGKIIHVPITIIPTTLDESDSRFCVTVSINNVMRTKHILYTMHVWDLLVHFALNGCYIDKWSLLLAWFNFYPISNHLPYTCVSDLGQYWFR